LIGFNILEFHYTGAKLVRLSQFILVSTG